MVTRSACIPWRFSHRRGYHPYVRQYAGAIGNDFNLMDDNARPSRALVVEDYIKGHDYERME